MRIRLRKQITFLTALLALGATLLAAAINTDANESDDSQELGPIESVLRLLNLMAEPAPLTLAHAQFDDDSSCVDCHTFGQGVPDDACLTCHALIGERMESGLGWHGQVTGDCITCHTDHEGLEFDIMEFDMPAFNHDRAIWRLEGAHRDLECQVCHVEHTAGEELVAVDVGLDR